MNLDFAFLADYAEAVQGKFYVAGGGINVLWRHQYPAPLDVSLCLRLEYNQAEAASERALRVVVNDADGNPIMPPLDAQFTPGPRAEGMPTQVPLGAVFAVRVGGAPVVPKPGSYAFEILLDGNHIASVPFVVAIPGT